MTLPAETSKAVFSGNGVAVDFPFSFKVWDVAQLSVVLTDPQGLDSTAKGWTASLGESGGTVTLRQGGKPLPKGWKLAILRNMPFTQGVDLLSGTRFDPQVIEDALDKATAERQQLKEAVERSIKVPPASDNPSELLAEMIFSARDAAAASAAEAEISARDAQASASNAADILQDVQTVQGNIGVSVESGLASIATASQSAAFALSMQEDSSVLHVLQTGQQQLSAVNTAANNALSAVAGQLGDIAVQGAEQATRVAEAGQRERVEIIAEGARQMQLVQNEGSRSLASLADQTSASLSSIVTATGRAESAADEAEMFADQAKSLAGYNIASHTNIGICPKFGDGFVLAGDVVNVTGTTLLSNPELDFPVLTALGYSYTLSMSSTTAIPAAGISHFDVFVDGQEAVRVPASEGGVATYSITVSGTDMQDGEIAVVAEDSAGNRSKVSRRAYSKRQVRVHAPRILTPQEGDVDIALKPLVTLTEFALSGMEDSPKFSRVQIARDAAFATMVWDSGDVAYNTSITVNSLLPDKTMLWLRARHSAATYGHSPWSPAVSASTIVKSVLPCRILAPLEGAADQALNVTLTLSPVQTTGISPTAAGTEVQISRTEDFSDVVFSYNAGYAVTVNTAGLPVKTKVYARARHKDGVLGWAAWSAAVSFTTLDAYVRQPAVTAPAANATGISPDAVVTVSAFANVGPVDSGKSTHIRIRKTDGTVQAEYQGAYKTSHTFANLPLLTPFVVDVRHEGKTWGWSAWSTAVTFTTMDAFADTPAVREPANNATGVARRPVITVSAYSNTGPADTANGTEIQVSTVNTFASMAASHSGGYVTSFTVPADLALNTAYFVRARHKGARWGWSAWSAVSKFTIFNAFTNVPSVTAPANNATGVAQKPAITVSAFSNTGPADTANGTEIQVSTVNTFASVAASHSGGYVTTFTPTANLALNTSHFVRVRHRGTTWGWSAWSAVSTFKTLAASLAVPVITAPVNNAVDTTLSPVVTLKAPTVVGQTVTQMQVQVSTANTFASTAWDSGTRAYSQSVTVGAALAKNVKYYVRVRLYGSVTGWTGYSAVTAFTTASAAPGDVWNYTANTTFTAPVAGTYKVEVVGGGGGGAYAIYNCYRCCYENAWYDVTVTHSESASGGSGGYSSWQGAQTKGSAYPVTVGGGGGGGNVEQNSQGGQSRETSGGSGGTSSFGSMVSANGGGGGYARVSSSFPDVGDNPQWYGCPEGTASNGGGGWGNTSSGSGGLGYGRGGGAGGSGAGGIVRITLISY